MRTRMHASPKIGGLTAGLRGCDERKVNCFAGTGSEFSQVYEGSTTESEGWKGRSVFQDEGWNFVRVLQKL